MDKTSKTPVTKNERGEIVPAASSTAIFSIQTLAYVRAVVGFGCIIAPSFAGKILQIPTASNSPQATILRIVGGRDFIIGGHLGAVKPPSNKPRTQEERLWLRRQLWANVAVDAIDVACIGYAAVTGSLGMRATMLGGGGALAFAGLSLLALRDI